MRRGIWPPCGARCRDGHPYSRAHPSGIRTRQGRATDAVVVTAVSLRGRARLLDATGFVSRTDGVLPRPVTCCPDPHGRARFFVRCGRRPRWIHRVADGHPIDVPVLLLWGLEDPAVREELADPERLEAWLARDNRPTIERLEGVGHFVQNEAPGPVTDALLAFLGSPA